MNTEELLEKIGKVIETKLEAERKHTGELIDQKLKPIKQDMATKADIEAMEKRIAEDMADFFHETWEKMTATNERVTKIEDHLGISHKN